MSFNLFVELGIIAEKCLDRLVYYVFLVSPVSICADQLSELSSIVSQMVDSDYIVSQGIVYFID